VEGKEVTGGVKKETLIFKMATDLGDLIWRPDPATDLGGVCRVRTGRRVQLAREASCGAGGITTGLRHLVWVWRGRRWHEEWKMATDLGDLIWRPDPATDLGGVCRVCTGRRVQLAREASCGAGGITTGLRHLVWVWRGRGWQEE